MAVFSNDRTFTIDNIKKIKLRHLYLFCIALILIFPFALFKSFPPLISFFTESSSVILACLVSLFGILSIKSGIRLNKVAIFCLVFAAYLGFDLIINNHVYPQITLLYIGSLLISAILSTTIVSSFQAYSLDKTFVFICGALMVGAMLQDLAGIIQLLSPTGIAGFVASNGQSSTIDGNLEQRNFYAHYLFWGLLATIYLAQSRNLKPFVAWSAIIIQVIVLGIANSRSVVLYIVVSTIILLLATFKTDLPKRQIFKAIAILLMVIISQMLLPIILSQLRENTMVSGVARYANSEGFSVRLYEWLRALLIFQEAPMFGHGWTSYAYQGFWMAGHPSIKDFNFGRGIFGHSHNIFTQLLAEIGIVGTTAIVGSFMWAIKSILFSRWSQVNLFAIMIVATSLTHSLVEFPLWLVNYFFVFILMLCFSIPKLEIVNHVTLYSSRFSYLLKYTFLAIAVFSLYKTIMLWQSYQNIVTTSINIDGSDDHADKINVAKALIQIGSQENLLNPYAEMAAVETLLGLESQEIPGFMYPAITNYASYIPHPNVSSYYLAVLCNDDKPEKAKLLTQQLLSYYPDKLAQFSIALSMTTCQDYYQNIYAQCQVYRESLSKKEQASTFCSINEIKIYQKEQRYN